MSAIPYVGICSDLQITEYSRRDARLLVKGAPALLCRAGHPWALGPRHPCRDTFYEQPPATTHRYPYFNDIVIWTSRSIPWWEVLSSFDISPTFYCGRR